MNKSKLIIIAVIVVPLAVAAGYFAGKFISAGGGADRTSGPNAPTETRRILYWKAPMDPNFRSDKPGKSPMGMDLVPVYADEGGGAGDVQIDPAVVNNLGVRTAEVRRGALSKRIEAVGYVGYDEGTVTSINTRADGWIEKLAVKSVGDTVRAGQLLYELFSPKLVTAEREYLTALASGSPSLAAASRTRMQALGFTAAQLHRLERDGKVRDRVGRRAEAAGVVISLEVREGAYVIPATQVMKLADLGTVWTLVEVEQNDAPLLHIGQQAIATFDAFPERRWQGKVDYVYPDIDPMTRTVRARLRFPNPDRRLQPNMYAHVTLQSAPRRDAVYIPDSALIRTGRSERVVVALGGGRFAVCPVESGITAGDEVEILKGLEAGQRVVISAQFLIDSEANVDAAALRLGANKPGCAGTPAAGGKETGQAGSGMDMSDMDMSMPAAAMSSQMPPPRRNGGTPHAPDGGNGMRRAPGDQQP